MAVDVSKKVEVSKKVVLGNTMLLIEKGGLKIGEVEERIGVSTGYLSRLNKEENSTKLGLDFVASLSEVLEMPMDILCRIDLTAMTSSELKVVQFMGRLTRETSLGSRRWSKDTAKDIAEMEVYSNGEPRHPLFKRDAHSNIYYGSSFAEKPGTTVAGDIFSTYLGNERWVFITRVKYPDVQGYDYEAYICTEDVDQYDTVYWSGLHPICATNPRFETGLDVAMQNLYLANVEATQHVQYDDLVNSTIDDFLNPPKPQPAPATNYVETDELPF